MSAYTRDAAANAARHSANKTGMAYIIYKAPNHRWLYARRSWAEEHFVSFAADCVFEPAPAGDGSIDPHAFALRSTRETPRNAYVLCSTNGKIYGVATDLNDAKALYARACPMRRLDLAGDLELVIAAIPTGTPLVFNLLETLAELTLKIAIYWWEDGAWREMEAATPETAARAIDDVARG